MKETNVYDVAGHRFAVTADSCLLNEMKRQYGPFLMERTTENHLLFSLKVVDKGDYLNDYDAKEMIVQDDGTQHISIGSVDNHSYYVFWLGDHIEGRLFMKENDRNCTLILEGQRHLYAVNNALMLLYMLTTGHQQTAVFHASVIEYEGYGYLFLGVSGTGKSTHSQLWLDYIEGTMLLNDDNPIVRVLPCGEVRVYGSPWSGKTPCYKNHNCPVRAFVNLQQAPQNEILRLNNIEAYAAVMSSISGKRWDRDMADSLHATEEILIQKIPVYHLRCLPNEAAAKLCCETINS